MTKTMTITTLRMSIPLGLYQWRAISVHHNGEYQYIAQRCVQVDTESYIDVEVNFSTELNLLTWFDLLVANDYNHRVATTLFRAY